MGTLWIIRQVTIYNGNVGSAGLYWNLVEQTTPAVLLHWAPITSDGLSDVDTFLFEGRIVIPYGQTLKWSTGSTLGATGMDVYIGGYTLLLP